MPRKFQYPHLSRRIHPRNPQPRGLQSRNVGRIQPKVAIVVLRQRWPAQRISQRSGKNRNRQLRTHQGASQRGNHQPRSIRVRFRVRSIRNPQHIPRKFDRHMLKSPARPQHRQSMFPTETNSRKRPRHRFIRTARRNEKTIKRSEHFNRNRGRRNPRK